MRKARYLVGAVAAALAQAARGGAAWLEATDNSRRVVGALTTGEAERLACVQFCI